MVNKDLRSMYTSDEEKTFSQDDILPKLPVPDLQQTIQKYIESVKPFVSPSKLAQTEEIAHKFEKGIGKKLHLKLLEKASIEKNWLKKWWEDYAYLTLREPLVPYYSMGGSSGLDAIDWPKGSTRLQRASLYCYFLAEFWQLLTSEKLIPAKSVEGKSFNMMQFRHLFNTTRAVGYEKDEIKSYFTTDSTCPSHVVILCRGRFFLMDVLAGQKGLLSAAEWEEQLARVTVACQDLSSVHGLATLTCDTRPGWAKNRDWLKALSPRNSKFLEFIDTALFVLVLDDDKPGSEADGLRLTLSGDLTGRWSDKSLSLIFFADGTIGALCDHAAFDGMVSITAFHYVFVGIQECGGRWLGSREILPTLAVPEEMKFDVDSVLSTEIARIHQNSQSYINLLAVVRKPFTGYGKLFIQHHKLHPDAYVQLGLQLAYFKLHKKPAPTYETATTRQFYCGRTETVRSCTVEAVLWIKEMMKTPRDNILCKELMVNALNKHNKLMKESREGMGCDRHLFGLQCLAMEMGLPVPEIFEDPAYKQSGGGGNFILSTSLVGYTSIGGSVAPMCLHGYGCFYNILYDRIYFSISTWRNSMETSAHKFFSAIDSSFQDIQDVLGFIYSKI